MRATSAFADADWDDIEGAVPSLHDFADTQPPKKVCLITPLGTAIVIIFEQVPRTEVVAQSFQDVDSAEDSSEDMDDAFGAYLINKNVLGRFQNEFLLNKSNRFTKCICRSKEDGWRK